MTPHLGSNFRSDFCRLASLVISLQFFPFDCTTYALRPVSLSATCQFLLILFFLLSHHLKNLHLTFVYVFLVPPPTFVSFTFLSTVVLVKLHDRYKEGGRALEKLMKWKRNLRACSSPLLGLRRTSSVHFSDFFFCGACNPSRVPRGKYLA